MGGRWHLWAEVDAYGRKLMLMGNSWRLQAEVGAYERKLVLSNF